MSKEQFRLKVVMSGEAKVLPGTYDTQIEVLKKGDQAQKSGLCESVIIQKRTQDELTGSFGKWATVARLPISQNVDGDAAAHDQHDVGQREIQSKANVLESSAQTNTVPVSGGELRIKAGISSDNLAILSKISNAHSFAFLTILIIGLLITFGPPIKNLVCADYNPFDFRHHGDDNKFCSEMIGVLFYLSLNKYIIGVIVIIIGLIYGGAVFFSKKIELMQGGDKPNVTDVGQHNILSKFFFEISETFIFARGLFKQDGQPQNNEKAEVGALDIAADYFGPVIPGRFQEDNITVAHMFAVFFATLIAFFLEALVFITIFGHGFAKLAIFAISMGSLGYSVAWYYEKVPETWRLQYRRDNGIKIGCVVCAMSVFFLWTLTLN